MVIRVFLMVIFLLPASAMWAFEHKTAEVNLHGVNYSEYTFRFYVVDPADPNAGGWGIWWDRLALEASPVVPRFPKVGALG